MASGSGDLGRDRFWIWVANILVTVLLALGTWVGSSLVRDVTEIKASRCTDKECGSITERLRRVERALDARILPGAAEGLRDLRKEHGEDVKELRTRLWRHEKDDH